MKATINFDLTDPNDGEEFNLIHQSKDMYFALRDITGSLRSTLKYGSRGYTEEEYDTLEKFRQEVIDILNEHEVSLEILS